MKKFLITLCLGLLMSFDVLAQVTIDGISYGTTYTLEDDITATNVSITSGSVLTIPNGFTLTVSGTLTSPDVTCLIIEEGGQLNYKGENSVYATAKKYINSFNETTQIGWYTLSTPIVSGILGSSLCNGDVDEYDLYCYLSEEPVWVESQDTEDLFMDVLGLGYLYANLNDGDYSLTGVINTGFYTERIPLNYNNSELNGFNLVGNPYTHNIYMGKHGNENCGLYHPHILPYYYTIDGGGWWMAYEYNDAIKPCQGFLIKSMDDNIGEVTINNNSDEPDSYPQEGFKSNRAFESKLIMTVSGDGGKDKIIVKTSEGIGLDKIDHISDIAPYFCVNYENKKYAVAHIGNNCKALDLIFRNKLTGFYTINVEDGLNDFSYLHLIDNITGEDVDLLMEPSYKFAANGNEFESRFKLIFTPNANNGDVDNVTFAYISNGDIIISGVDGSATLQIFDVMGRMIGSEVISGIEGSVCRVAKPNVSGVYVLRLIEGNNVDTQKIVVE